MSLHCSSLICPEINERAINHTQLGIKPQDSFANLMEKSPNVYRNGLGDDACRD
ncbi:hypothetical protein JCM14467A_00010 [Vulcanisaeta sp. JCM 14467]